MYWRIQDGVPKWEIEEEGGLPSNCMKSEFRDKIIAKEYEAADE